MGREPDFDGGRSGSVDEFEAIVAGWRAEGRVPEWPADRPTDPTEPTLTVDPHEPPTRPHAIVPRDLDEHFIPPEPPPLPRIGPPALVGAVLLALGLLLVLVPGWFGMTDLYGLPLGLVCLAAGLGWLVLRLWPDSVSAVDHGDDDDGAIV